MYQRRDYGFASGGFLIAVLLILLILYYRGGMGPNGIGMITGIFRPVTVAPVTETRPYTPYTETQQIRPIEGTVPPPTQSRGSTRVIATLRVKASELNMRRCAGLDCGIIVTLPQGTELQVLGDRRIVGDQEWYRVRAGNREGWVDRYQLE